MDFANLMNRPLKASRKSTGKNGQTYWNQCGYTVWLGEYQGNAQVSLVDERTGERYPCFPPKPREDAVVDQGQAMPGAEDVPF